MGSGNRTKDRGTIVKVEPNVDDHLREHQLDTWCNRNDRIEANVIEGILRQKSWGGLRVARLGSGRWN